MTLRGGPDYGVWAPKHTVTALVDLAELAARLQSPYIFDRRGDVVFMDDFEDPPLKWLIDAWPGGALAERSSTTAFAGGWSARLRPGNAAWDLVKIEKRIFEPEIGRCGLTIHLCTPLPPTITDVGINLPSGGVIHEGVIRLSPVLNVVEYLSPENLWVTLAPLPALPQALHAFWPIKLILDFERATYREFLLGPYNYDMKHIPLRRWEGRGLHHACIYIRVTAEAAGNADVYIDNVVFTRNEP